MVMLGTTYPAIDIANWFIDELSKSDKTINNLKLQKLLYYSEAWHQVINNAELFFESIEAWSHGPAVPSVFRAFESFNWNPISANGIAPLISNKTKSILMQVLDVYGDLTESVLESMSQEDAPWIVARGDCSPEERCEAVILKSEIKWFFKQKYNV
jgi:uncharacterized phage-associated protein